MFPWIHQDLDARRRQGLYRERRRLQSGQGPRVRFRGREFLNFASNDYLDLATDARLARAAAAAALRFGCGAGASPLVSGHQPTQAALERSLARWQRVETALIFCSGFTANLAVLGTLAGAGDAIFSDELNHASLIDGCRLARSQLHIYRHGDVNHLANLLRQEGGSARRRLIVSDSVFSMDGHLAPVTDLLDLAEKEDCLVILDEAHATGVLGEQGRGVTSSLRGRKGVERVVKVGTLSKALGTQGGFVCGTRELSDWLVNFARPYVYSTALAPTSAAAARRAVRVVEEEPERRSRLLALAEFLRTRLREIGYSDAGSRCQVVPVMVGEAAAAVELSARLEDRGIFAPAIRPPTVPSASSRLRISLTAGHTEDDVARLVDALREFRSYLHPPVTAKVVRG